MGEPIREQSDLFGKAVILASRITEKAEGGQVLASQIVHALVAGTVDAGFREMGMFRLKGISGAHLLYEVLWRQS